MIFFHSSASQVTLIGSDRLFFRENISTALSRVFNIFSEYHITLEVPTPVGTVIAQC
jgi:hypothetical protein